MARFLKYLAFLAVLALWLAPTAVLANGTPQATMIANTCTIMVQGAGDSLVNSNFDTRVANITGDTIDTTAGGNANANWGDSRYFTFRIYNTGNATDSMYIYPTFTYHGGADSFIVAIGAGGETSTQVVRNPAVVAGWAWPAADSIGVGPIAEDAYTTVQVAVSLPAVATGNNGDGDSLTVRLNFRPWIALGYDTNPTGQYTGDNGTLYAAQNSSFVFDTITVAGAVFQVTKTGTCTIGGNLSPVVPGATLNYRIDWSNTGSGAGSNVIVYDQIDTASTIFVSYDTSSSPGWLAQWGGATVDDFSMGSADFTSGNPGTPGNVRWIRFTSVTVAPGNGKIYYRVYVR